MALGRASRSSRSRARPGGAPNQTQHLHRKCRKGPLCWSLSFYQVIHYTYMLSHTFMTCINITCREAVASTGPLTVPRFSSIPWAPFSTAIRQHKTSYSILFPFQKLTMQDPTSIHFQCPTTIHPSHQPLPLPIPPKTARGHTLLDPPCRGRAALGASPGATAHGRGRGRPLGRSHGRQQPHGLRATRRAQA